MSRTSKICLKEGRVQENRGTRGEQDSREALDSLLRCLQEAEIWVLALSQSSTRRKHSEEQTENFWLNT